MVAISLLTLTTSPAHAAGPSLSVIELSGSIHINGSAIGGLNLAAIMSTPNSDAIKPYAYGKYNVIWNLSNPTLKTITQYRVDTYSCDSYARANSLSVNPLSCGQSELQTIRQAETEWKKTSAWTFVHTFGDNTLHKKWIRGLIRVKFSDGSSVTSWSKSRFYITDSPRVSNPVPSLVSDDGQKVPQTTPMSIQFSQWSGLNEWNANATQGTRRAIVVRCNDRNISLASTYLSTTSFPAGCTRLASNGLFEPAVGNISTLNFTSGVEGTYIYAIDTVSFNLMPTSGDTVYLQKRTEFLTYNPVEQTDSGNVSTGPGAPLGILPNYNPTPLEQAGINIATAPIVSSSGSGTINNITVVMKSSKSYKRGTQLRSLNATFAPKSKAAGIALIALVSTTNGKQKVHLVKKKQVKNGKVTWKWRFLKKYPRKTYRIYLQFSPDDSSVPPMTLTKRVKLT